MSDKRRGELKRWLSGRMNSLGFLRGEEFRCDAEYAEILSLIEHGPEVSRAFVVNSARAMGAAPDALAMVLEEAGVRVKEGK